MLWNAEHEEVDLPEEPDGLRRQAVSMGIISQGEAYGPPLIRPGSPPKPPWYRVAPLIAERAVELLEARERLR